VARGFGGHTGRLFLESCPYLVGSTCVHRIGFSGPLFLDYLDVESERMFMIVLGCFIVYCHFVDTRSQILVILVDNDRPIPGKDSSTPEPWSAIQITYHDRR